MSVISNYWGNSILANWLTDNEVYLSLHTYNPGVLGDAASEIATAGYSRQRIYFGSASAKTVGSTNSVLFGRVPAVTITHFGVWDSLVGGNLLFAISLDTSVTAPAVTNLSIGAGDVAITL